MSTKIWTFSDDGKSVADQYDAEAMIEGDQLAVDFDGTGRVFPLDVIASLLRTAGYDVTPPPPRHAGGERPDEET